MPVAVRAAAVYNFTLTPRDPIPLVRGWNRLEGRPRSADFERSLRAEVRDPLWFLTRQWQFGEFEGDDAGSPIDARIAYRDRPARRLSFRRRHSALRRARLRSRRGSRVKPSHSI